MRAMIRKISWQNGESLAEVLVAVLISAVGLLVLSSMIMVATHMMDTGEERISAIYDAMSTVETRKASTGETDQLKIEYSDGTSDTVHINIYRDDAGTLMSYEKV